MIEKQTGKQVKCLCTDNGLEFFLMSLTFYVRKRELLDIVQFIIL